MNGKTRILKEQTCCKGRVWRRNLLLFGLVFSQVSMFSQSPGGVTGSAIWLKSNTGVTPTTDNATMTAWSDQSGNGVTVSNGTATAWPTYKNNTTDNMNYNPTVTFDGTADNLNLGSALGLTGTSATIFSVLRTASGAAGNDAILGSQSNSNNVPLVYIANASSPYALAISRQNSSTVTSNSQITGQTPALLAVRRNGTTSVNFWFNGTNQTSGSPTMSGTWTSANRRLGATQGASNQWFLAANLSEFIVYSGSLSDAQVQQVESYLALKYGITMTAKDYVASDGSTTFWSQATNTGFTNNIAGIGRDDSGGGGNSQLVQKQSRSINTASSGDLVIMGLNSIATNNASNTGTFSANRSFLVWGDNAGSNTWQTTESYSGARQRLAREWRVQETGTVGSVVVRVQDNSATAGGELPAEVSAVYLWVDADGDFSSGVTEYAMTLSGTNWETSVDFTTGQYFTFATQVAIAPGGVSGGTFWVKADAGTSTTVDYTSLATWTDQSGSGNNATGGTSPTYRNNTADNVNFNPVVAFNGTTQYLNIASNLGLTTTNVGTVFSLFKTQYGVAGPDVLLGAQTNTASAAQIYLSNAASPYAMTIDRIGGTAPNGLVSSLSSYNQFTPLLGGVRRNGTAVKFWLNGADQTSGTPNMTNAWASANRRLGATQTTAVANFFQGEMAEMMVFGSSLSDVQVGNIESYLAIKYGITLSHSYFASDYNGSTGTTFWDIATNAGFNNNIAGIGRDDLSSLNQKQSRSANTTSSGNLVTIGLGSIATNNASNANTFSADRVFAVWGDNAGSNVWSCSETPSNRVRLLREWKIVETGSVGSVQVQVPDDGAASGNKLPTEVSTVYLLVDADGNFSSGATEYAMTLNGTNWQVSVDFSGAQYFTFATQIPGVITLSNVTVGACINHPLMDVATMSVQVAWTNAPANDTIEVSIYAQTERIFVAAGATSPQTLNYTVQADGTTGNSITARWRYNSTLCTSSTTYDAPAACSNDSLNCNILYLCGEDKPYDGDAWDHGFMNYLDIVNGTKTVSGILTKPDASGMGTYDPNSPSTFVSVNLNDYDLIIVSATTEAHIATALVNALKDFSGAVLCSNYDLIDNLGLSNSAGDYQFQTNLYTDNSTSAEIYNYNNIYNSYAYVFTRGDPVTGGDDYLWTNAGEEAAFINSAYFAYDINDALPGVGSGHGRRVYLGYHMNGIYMNPQNGGTIPAPTESWFYPAKHLTLTGKNYFDQALVSASLSCVVEICTNGTDDNGDGLVDCSDAACPNVVFFTQPSSTTLCPGTSANLSVTVYGGSGFTYQWQYNSGTSGSPTWGNVADGTPANSDYSNETSSSMDIAGNIASGTYQYRVYVNNSVGCPAYSNIASIAAASSATAGTDQTQCNNAVFSLSGNQPAGATGAWTVVSGTATVATPSSASSTATASTTNVTLRWTLTEGSCTSYDEVALVYNILTGSASNDGPHCPGTSIQLFSLPGSLASYSWSGPVGFSSSLQNPIITSASSVNTGTYSVTLTDSTGCSTTVTTTVTVKNAPTTPGPIGY